MLVGSKEEVRPKYTNNDDVDHNKKSDVNVSRSSLLNFLEPVVAKE